MSILINKSIKDKSEHAAKYNHNWTWNNHNTLITQLKEYNEYIKRTDEYNEYYKNRFKKVKKVIDEISKCTNIKAVKNILEKNVEYLKDTYNNKIKIYIAGTTTEIEYRKHVKQKYKNIFELHDPMEEVNQHDLNLVVKDKELILNCDILVAIVKKFTCGTIMEIEYAYENKIPVYVITKEKLMNDKWLSFHTYKFFQTISTCFDDIIKTYNISR